MQDQQPNANFWIANVILGIALVAALFIQPLWDRFGYTAMLIWVVLVGLGVYLLLKDRGSGGDFPD